MKRKVTVYLNEDMERDFNICDNKSKVVKEALNLYFNNEDLFKLKLLELNNRVHEYEFKISNERLLIGEVEKILKRIECRKNARPFNYEDAVNTLKVLSDVNEEDLMYQASLLNVSVNQFKKWLKDDGYYDEIYSNP